MIFVRKYTTNKFRLETYADDLTKSCKLCQKDCNFCLGNAPDDCVDLRLLVK